MTSKIALIGSGQIGGTLGLLALQKQLGEVVLFDVMAGTARGKSLDLSQMSSLFGNDFRLKGSNEYKEIEGADVCIITSGFPRKPGMSRGDLISKNLEVMKQVAEGVQKHAPNAFVIVITNPLDAMVYAFQKFSGFDPKRVVGMAGVLDSARFKTFLSFELGISTEDIFACVMGGHGDDMVPLVRFSSAGGIPLPTLVEMGLLKQDRLEAIIDRTRKGGGEIVELLQTGSAFYAPALSAIQMAESFLYNKKRLLPCAAFLRGEYGVKDLFIGVPCILGKDGVEKILELKLLPDEQRALDKSIASVRALIAEIAL